MNDMSELENDISVLESVLRRSKIECTIAKNKQQFFEKKQDELQELSKLVLYNVAKQKSINSIDTYVNFLQET